MSLSFWMAVALMARVHSEGVGLFAIGRLRIVLTSLVLVHVSLSLAIQHLRRPTQKPQMAPVGAD
jgi:hypothetical protein